MTVPATARRAGPFNGNGVTTSFPFTFKVFAASDIEVVLADSDGLETELVLGSGYSVTLNSDQDASPGGAVIYPLVGTPLPAGSTLTVRGAIPYDQTLDLPSGGAFSPRALENALDRTVIQVQQLAEETARGLKLPVSSTADPVLPAPESNKVIGWNDSASGLVNRDITDLASAIAYGTNTTQFFGGNGTATQFTLAADPGSVHNLDVSISGVVQSAVKDFTLSGLVLTFLSAPPAGTNNIAVRYGQALPVGTADSADVTFLPAGTGATTRSVQSKLRESVSGPDFGAVGDGVTDDTVAVQAAIDAFRDGTLVVPPGEYLLNGDVRLLLKGHAPNEGGYIIQAHGALFTGTGRIILDSCKRVQINGLDFANKDLVFRGTWWTVVSQSRFKRLVLGDAAGTVFSSNYWNVFESSIFQSVVTNAASPEPSNEFMFDSCSMRGSADQGFTATAAYAFEFNANQNVQSWKFKGGDISYHTAGIYTVAGGNSQDVELEFDGTYFDTVLPAPTNRARTRIVSKNCHAANIGAYTAKLQDTTCGAVDLFRSDRSAKHSASSGYNLIPNGDFGRRLTTWEGPGLPLGYTGGATLTAGDGGLSGTFLNVNQSATTGNSVAFRCKALPYAGRLTGVIVARNAAVGTKTMRVGIDELYADLVITNTEWSVLTLTKNTIKAAGAQADILLFTNDGTAFNVDVAYVGFSLGEGGDLLKVSPPARTILHQELWNPASIGAGATISKDFTVAGAESSDFAQVSAGGTTSFLSVSHPIIVGANQVRVHITNTTGAPIDLGESTWRVLVTKAAAYV